MEGEGGGEGERREKENTKEVTSAFSLYSLF